MYSLVPSKTGSRLVAHTRAGEYSMRVQPTGDGRLRLRSTRGNMPRLVEILAGQLGELVVDRTGLSGLRLEAGRQPMEAIVIDQIERPTED